MSKKFKMEPHSAVDKGFDIYSDEIRLTVDFDDVDHLVVEKAAKWVLKALNEYEDLRFRMDSLEK